METELSPNCQNAVCRKRHVTNTAQSLSSTEIACLSRNNTFNQGSSRNKRTYGQPLSFSLISSPQRLTLKRRRLVRE